MNKEDIIHFIKGFHNYEEKQIKRNKIIESGDENYAPWILKINTGNTLYITETLGKSTENLKEAWKIPTFKQAQQWADYLDAEINSFQFEKEDIESREQFEIILQKETNDHYKTKPVRYFYYCFDSNYNFLYFDGDKLTRDIAEAWSVCLNNENTPMDLETKFLNLLKLPYNLYKAEATQWRSDTKEILEFRSPHGYIDFIDGYTEPKGEIPSESIVKDKRFITGEDSE